LPLEHVEPAGQHLVDAPLPHAVVPFGHPHRPLFLLMQATPLLQQDVPHGVVPWQQQVTVAGSEQVSPLLQHPFPQNVLMLGSQPQRPVRALTQIRPGSQQLGPHGVFPGAHGCVSSALARKGPSTLAATAPTTAPPTAFSTPRRGIEPDIVRES
jgi:hypothetical protein